MLERLGELSIFRGVFGGEARDAARGFGVVVVEEEGFAVRRGSEEARIGVQEVALEFFELHDRSTIGTAAPDRLRSRCGPTTRAQRFPSPPPPRPPPPPSHPNPHQPPRLRAERRR